VRYRLSHETHYRYSEPASLSHNQNRLRPRDLPYQRVFQPDVQISPKPVVQRTWVDWFGNTAEFFSIENSHQELLVLASSTIDRFTPTLPKHPMLDGLTDQSRGMPNELNHSTTWDQLVRQVQNRETIVERYAGQFLFDSRYAYRSQELLNYTLPSFSQGRNLIEGLLDFTQRINRDFEYDPNATQISTPVQDVLRGRRGVCQDFAHLQIAGLRSIGIPARYVSGYLLTYPPPGQPKLIGSDASHAWVSAYIGNGEWLDLDPTNNMIPRDEHITLGWGRDYNDIAPLQGVLLGHGYSTLSVKVDVIPVEPVRLEPQLGGQP
jgi:transglutaminase-like putative cysteine protease